MVDLPSSTEIGCPQCQLLRKSLKEPWRMLWDATAMEMN